MKAGWQRTSTRFNLTSLSLSSFCNCLFLN